MPRIAKKQTKRAGNRFYHSAKISEYQFKRVLWSFVLDEPVAKAARHINLSANSINAIYGKLRVYFFEASVFTDYYRGGNPLEHPNDDLHHEKAYIEFHLARAAARRGIDDKHSEHPYHLAESHWRFGYASMVEGRLSDTIYRMMFSHLMEIIRACGPVGTPPVNRKKGLQLALKQFDQRLLWMERNSPEFRDNESRKQLREIREF